ncbi:MAG: alanine--tRNA ligase [Candidatus Omnitrophota bacterium]|nr:alanine--tRNA ligase [Candidatus Omnitrophota bacterium]
MTCDEIRRRYLRFFESRKHKIIPSDSLIPANDPSVLFTSAGMNQFKEQFMGINISFKRATTCQKCLRTGDLDKVGKTAGHHTFFEMLGNFSFGDYFKKDAIIWAWEFMVSELKIPADRLWVSVYKDDDEAYDIWKNDIKIPEHKIKRYGAHDNFWPQNAIEDGPDGPCGPCSEIFYDQGEDTGCSTKHCEPSCSCGRFVEVWNLVFTQFNRAGKNNLTPLKNKNIDTGMGLERIARVMQGVRTNFDTDIFAPITGEIYKLAGDRKEDKAFRVNAVADHMRAIVFMIAGGVLPSNEERGYVVRMLIRRAFRFGKELGIELPFLYKLVPSVAKAMKEPYPEIETMRENIADVILSEEKKFQNTLEEGVRVMDELVYSYKTAKKKIISGKDAFRLYDTYGFPLELTMEMAESKGLTVDKDGYEKEMELQRETARTKSKMKVSIFDDSRSESTIKKLSDTLKATVFSGHSKLESEARILAMVRSGSKVRSAKKGDRIEIILDKTPFYGESGGQLGDSGEILTRTGKAIVGDTKKAGGLIVHIAEIVKGDLKSGAKVKAIVDKDSRLDIARNHTATHLLHYALREVLGRHVKQSGSLVARDRLRFDFSHFKAVDKRELDRVEDIVNVFIRENLKVKTEHLNQESARKKGAMALFGEKYGKRVRMVSIGECSKELCGGTHLDYTGQIGIFRISSESSIASGMRRIEAITGRTAYKSLKNDEEIISDLRNILKTPKQDLVKEVEYRLAKEKEMAKISGPSVKMEDLNQKDVKGVKVISGYLKGVPIEEIRGMDNEIRKKIGSGVIVLGSDFAGKVSFTCSASGDLVSRGVNANDIIKRIAAMVNGSGGGKPTVAQAGGKDIGKLGEALSEVAIIVEKELEK